MRNITLFFIVLFATHSVMANHEVGPDIHLSLTDNNGMQTFVSSIKSSRTLPKENERKLVEQVMSGKAGFFRKRIFLLLEITESAPHEIIFIDVLKKSFKSYRGSWTLTQTNGGMQIQYQLFAKPDFFSPGFLTLKAFKNTAADLLREVHLEMISRETQLK
jgi:Polyketide cyclase / dehydrase and lipid transport